MENSDKPNTESVEHPNDSAGGHAPEKTVERQTVYEGMLHIFKDKVTLPNGKLATREVVEHTGSVCIVAVNADKLYFVRQYRHSAREFMVELPAGTLEEGEDAETTAYREIQEEIGFSAGKMTFLFEGFVSPGYTNELQRFYLAEDLTPAHADRDDDEFIDVVTMTWSAALATLDRGEFRDTKTVAGLLAAARKLGIR